MARTEHQREARPFKLVTDFEPSGDQPQAIEALVANAQMGIREQVLLGG